MLLQPGGDGVHHLVGPPSRLVVLQLEITVTRGLPGEDRVVRQLRVPVGAVASAAILRFLPAGLDLDLRSVDLGGEPTWQERQKEGGEDRCPPLVPRPAPGLPGAPGTRRLGPSLIQGA